MADRPETAVSLGALFPGILAEELPALFEVNLGGHTEDTRALVHHPGPAPPGTARMTFIPDSDPFLLLPAHSFKLEVAGDEEQHKLEVWLPCSLAVWKGRLTLVVRSCCPAQPPLLSQRDRAFISSGTP